MSKRVTCIVVGSGGMARHHIRAMLEQRGTTTIVGYVEVSEEQRQAVRDLYAAKKFTCPPFYASIHELVRAQGRPDAAFICTPHVYHFANTRDAMVAGMDVLLEKPMVMNAAEARRLIALRDRTQRLLVVAFPGSLSPAIRKAKELIRQGKIGRLTSVAAWVHQQWKQATTGKWRQVPKISGGGFLFDTGSHMLNTVVDVIGEDVAEVTALFDNRGTPVEINASVSGRSKGGVMFSLAAAGDSIQCISDVMFCGDAGVIQTGIWGERLNLKTTAKPEFNPVKLPKSRGVWQQFLAVRAGRLPNPCPPEVGLRFAQLMDMIRKSARTGRTVRR